MPKYIKRTYRITCDLDKKVKKLAKKAGGEKRRYQGVDCKGSMRPIKFRFWDKTGLDGPVYGTPPMSPSMELSKWIETLGEQNIKLDQQPWVPMQFTGLKDKNGVEIYEGDVCVFWKDGPSAGRMVVEWGDGAFILKGTDEKVINLLSFCQVPEFEIEIIGNRFENPELIQPDGV